MGIFRFTTGLGVGIVTGAHLAQTYNLPRVKTYILHTASVALHLEKTFRKGDDDDGDGAGGEGGGGGSSSRDAPSLPPSLPPPPPSWPASPSWSAWLWGGGGRGDK